MSVQGPQPMEIDGPAEFDSVPLFMRQPLSEADPESSTNVAYEALRSLLHEGTPNERAINFKEQGNEYFRGKRFREAANFYTQGINVKPEGPILQALLLNRAACNLELKNFGSVLRDTAQTLQSNPKSSKALYRSSLALTSLERYPEALDACQRCAEIEGDSKSHQVQAHLERVTHLKRQWDIKEAEKLEKARKEREEKRIMNAVFQSLHLIVAPSSNPPPPTHAQYAPHFDPTFSNYRTSATPVLFPVFLLYPQHGTSDLITSFDPSSSFASHLSVMFPPTPGAPPLSPVQSPSPSPPTAPNWDRTGEYTASNLVVYATTFRGKTIKIGKKKTLRDACDAAAALRVGQEDDGLTLRDGSLSFSVLPRGERERAWLEEIKKRPQSG